MLRTSVFTIVLMLTAGAGALAQQPSAANQGNDNERAACHPDVIRYCHELVKADDQSDIFAILSCLQTNRPRISAACREVLASHGQ